MVLLVATKKLRYDGKELVPGNEFEASEKDAMILRAIDKAQNVAPPVISEPRRAPLPKKTAATPVPPEPAPPPVVEVAPEPAKVVEPIPETVQTAPTTDAEESLPHVSRYKRRDLQAQE